NGYVESFNARLRDECLNINSFYSLLHAQVIIGDWKYQYNHDRRHSSLGYLAPVGYAQTCTHRINENDSHTAWTYTRGRLTRWIRDFRTRARWAFRMLRSAVGCAVRGSQTTVVSRGY